MKKVIFSVTLTLTLLIASSQTRGSEELPPLDETAQSWVESTLSGLSLEEKVGQLIIGRTGTQLHQPGYGYISADPEGAD